MFDEHYLHGYEYDSEEMKRCLEFAQIAICEFCPWMQRGLCHESLYDLYHTWYQKKNFEAACPRETSAPEATK